MNDQRKKVAQFVLPRGFAGRVTVIFMNRGHKSIYENVAKVLELQPEDEVQAMMKEGGFSEVSITYAKGFMMPKLMIACAVK